uniref:Uncharacterized protein n=1 Tax=Klebsiella pneumoniae TaxID=573 RepID=A0A8B0SR22_KLEPN|nr:hypothetical protein [Klebsiella pneumoniae]
MNYSRNTINEKLADIKRLEKTEEVNIMADNASPKKLNRAINVTLAITAR